MTSRIALVTGAGSGIGRTVALALAERDYRVVLAGRRREPLHETAALAGERAANTLVVPADVTDASSVASLFERTVDAYGRLDLLFNNAGRGAAALPFEDLPPEQWQAVVDTNLTGTFLCMQAAFRVMKRQQPSGGRIINNGSISAHAPRPRSAAYTTTKHGITGLTKAGALDGRAYGIAVGQIDIGNAATDMTERMAEGVLQANGEVAPEPRMEVRHVADAVLYMAGLPLDTNVLFMTVMASAMPFVGRG